MFQPFIYSSLSTKLTQYSNNKNQKPGLPLDQPLVCQFPFWKKSIGISYYFYYNHIKLPNRLKWIFYVLAFRIVRTRQRRKHPEVNCTYSALQNRMCLKRMRNIIRYYLAEASVYSRPAINFLYKTEGRTVDV